MANRPCRTDGDLKRLWQLLLPDTALPACGTREKASADADENAAPPDVDEAEARPEFPRKRRDSV